MVVYLIVESKNWVQYSKSKKYRSLLSNYKIRIITLNQFKILWKINLLRKKHIIFSSWRLAIELINKNIFEKTDYQYFMGCVTSHSNLDDSLLNNYEKAKQFEKAIKYLINFKIVTVNSKILFELLKSKIPNLYYCPNGIDPKKFYMFKDKKFDPNNIRIGFVSKNRAIKRIDLLESVIEKMKFKKNLLFNPIIIERDYKSKVYNENEMRNYYNNLDFYLCLSNQEGTPNPAIEAAACGNILISTKVGNMPEIIKNDFNSFLIDHDIEKIINKLKQILSISPDNYYFMRNLLLEEIRLHWTWETNIKYFEKALCNLTTL